MHTCMCAHTYLHRQLCISTQHGEDRMESGEGGQSQSMLPCRIGQSGTLQGKGINKGDGIYKGQVL